MHAGMAFRHVLCATDFSETSRRAVDTAAALAARLGARLTLVHAYAVVLPPYPIALTPDTDQLGRAASAELEKVRAEVASKIPAVEAVTRPGDARDKILEVAKERGCDLIVLGTHGHRGVMRWLLGSVAEGVVRRSPVPVLTVRGEESAV